MNRTHAVTVAAGVLIGLAAFLVPSELGERAGNQVGSAPDARRPTYQLTIKRSGPLTGQLRVQPVEGAALVSSVACAQAACTVTLPRGDYALVADGDARVVSWGGACPEGVPICAVLVDRDRSVNVSTDRAVKTLTLKKLGDGIGNLLLSGPPGMTCGGTCLYDPPDDLVQTVTLRAEPAHAFAGWQGACSGPEPTCTVQVDQALEAVGTFR